MAINLQAVLRLDGNQFTREMRKVERWTQQANRVMQSMNTANAQLSRAMGISSSSSRTLTASQSQLRSAMQSSQSATSQLSSTQGRLQRQTRATSNAQQQLANSTKRTTREFNLMNSTASSTVKSIGGVTSAVFGLAGAYASVQGAKKALESTIGEAAVFEQSTVMISAMLNDKELGKEYIKMVDKFAVDSPIMDSQSMLRNSKSFITQSKDLDQLEQMWSLTERLAAIDPYQGVEGAVFALRELFSGDAISMVRRFEMPKDVMNEIKNMDLDAQLAALDKYFNSIGMTQQLIDDMGNTTLGVWNQIKEATNVILRDMGGPALNVVKDFLNTVETNMASVQEVVDAKQLFSPEEYTQKLNQAIKFEEFQQTGAKILESVLTGVTNAAKSVGNWLNVLTGSKEWQDADGFAEKFTVAFSSAMKSFQAWINGDGKSVLTDVVSTLTETLATLLETLSGPLVDAAITIGEAFAKGLLDGATTYLSENWKSIIPSSIKNSPLGNSMSIGLGAATKAMDKKTDGNFSKATKQAFDIVGNKIPFFSKKNGGLDRVPYDGATYSLHKDEMILSRGEAAEYRRGNGGGVTIAKLADQIIVREEADIEKIGRAIVRELSVAGHGGYVR